MIAKEKLHRKISTIGSGTLEPGLRCWIMLNEGQGEVHRYGTKCCVPRQKSRLCFQSVTALDFDQRSTASWCRDSRDCRCPLWTMGKKIDNLPPGPRNWPVIGALLEMEPLFHKSCEKFAAKYGPIIFFRLGVQSVVVVSSAETAKELLKHKDVEFSDRLTFMNKSAAKYTAHGGKTFPFANYDVEFKLHRKLFITENFTLAKIKTYENLRTQEMAAMVEKILSVIRSTGRSSSDIDDNNRTSPIGIRSTAMATVQNILFTLLVGTRFDSLPPTDKLREFPEQMDILLNIFMQVNLADLFPWLTWFDPQGLLKEMRELRERQKQFYEALLEKSRREMKLEHESGAGNDADTPSSNSSFVRTLLRAQENGTDITDNGIHAILDSFASAGIDTTGSQVEWVLLELARHPKELKKLQREIDGVVGTERALEEADLQTLPFLNAVILESLRLHGIAPFSFPHVNSKPSTLSGYDIPANTAVLLNGYTIGRDPKVWKDPLQFNPDRFMAGGSSANPTLPSDMIKANGLDFILLPFGSGRRVCPGYNLAIVLLLLITGTLVHAFDWFPPPGCSEENLSIDEVGSFLLHPTPDLYLVPVPRSASSLYKSNITLNGV